MTDASVVNLARTAQLQWAQTTPADRCQWLHAAHTRIYDQRHALAEVVADETGKAPGEALAADIGTALDVLRWLIRVAPSHLEERRFRSGTLALWRKRITVRRVPFGVVGVIAPWNYPVMIPVSHVASALVAGNAVLLKPSELTAGTADLLVSLLEGPELPEGLLQVVHGGPTAGEFVVDHADKVCFTGSERVGRAVAARCAERLIPSVLELGGCDAAIVCEDADIGVAARGIVWGRFANAGQTCVAPKRVFVVGAAYAPFVAAVQAEVERLVVDSGPGRDMGPLAAPTFAAPLHAVVEDAIASGARAFRPHQVGDIFPPTILTDLKPDAAALNTETFGPVLPVVSVHSDDDAVARANASPMQLAASVWSRSRSHGASIAWKLRAGTITINDVATAAGMPEVPHGGSGTSGHGRSHGAIGLEEFVQSRSVVDDVLPRRGQPWWFPYRGQFMALDGYLRLSHGRGLLDRVKGVAGTLRLLRRR